MAEVWFKLSEQQPEEYEVVNVKDFGMAWYSRDLKNFYSRLKEKWFDRKDPTKILWRRYKKGEIRK